MVSRRPISPPPNSQPDHFLVCGLGSLGQQCVANLIEFGVLVTAIDAQLPAYWEIPELPEQLELFVQGDCRLPSVLEQAGVQRCRAIVLVTSDERINLEAALAARLLNTEIRLVVRSAKQNLNSLLQEGLGNFVALEATQLSASAFALPALGDETLGLFNLDQHLLRVVRYPVAYSGRMVHELNTRQRRVIAADRAEDFYTWEVERPVPAGQTLIFVEQVPREEPKVPEGLALTERWGQLRAWLGDSTWQQKLRQVLEAIQENQVRRVAFFSVATLLVLLGVGTLLFSIFYPETQFSDAFFATAIVLLGGYGDVFGGFKSDLAVPGWLRFFGLGLNLAGIAFVGVLYGLLTESLLAAKFQLPTRRPTLPTQDHIVIIGLGRVGQRVGSLLQDFRQPLVALNAQALGREVLPQLPLIIGNPVASLAKVHLAQAKSVLVVTDDEMLNLELGLMARNANPNANLVIRIFEPQLSASLTKLMPYAKVLCAYALAAEAFAAAAFGENILGLFRLGENTILVTEYRIDAIDTLHDLLLAQVSYGYGVVPLLHQRPNQAAEILPAEDIQIRSGDRLIVLASLESLQRIERGQPAPCLHQVQVERILTADAGFEGAKVLARLTGCSMAEGRNLMENLPALVPMPLYEYQAHSLIRELYRTQVVARLMAIDP